VTKSFITALCFLAMATVATAGPFLIDGSLSDWGVDVQDGNGSNINAYIPVAGVLGWVSEDQNDGAGNGGFLGPNAGGQNYDAEWMGVAQDGGNLYIAIVTGQRPDNTFTMFAPGDIRLEIDGTTFGIEIGGGPGTDNAAYTPIVGSLGNYGEGSTYMLTGTGHTAGYNGYQLPELQTAGSIWNGPAWILDPISPKGPVQVDHQFVGGNAYVDHVGEYVYTLSTVTTQHAIIELSIPFATLGVQSGSVISAHWRPGCGNDELDINGVVHTPEPGTALLLLLGGVGLAGIAIRRQRS
jgi:PEP-CTERM motif